MGHLSVLAAPLRQEKEICLSGVFLRFFHSRWAEEATCFSMNSLLHCHCSLPSFFNRTLHSLHFHFVYDSEEPLSLDLHTPMLPFMVPILSSFFPSSSCCSAPAVPSPPLLVWPYPMEFHVSSLSLRATLCDEVSSVSATLRVSDIVASSALLSLHLHLQLTCGDQTSILTATTRLDRETGMLLETSPIDFYVDESAIRLLGSFSDTIGCLPATHTPLLAATTGDSWKEPEIPRFSVTVRIPEIALDLAHLVKLSVGKVGIVGSFHVVFAPNQSRHLLAGSRPPLSGGGKCLHSAAGSHHSVGYDRRFSGRPCRLLGRVSRVLVGAVDRRVA